MRRRSGLSMVFVALFAVHGCTAPPDDINDAEPRPAPPGYATIAAQYNDRVSQLVETYARGVVELRWVDDDGRRHLEPQVDFDAWINLPRHTSFRLEKLGELLLWAGSDQDGYWVFDLLDEPTTLRMGEYGDGASHRSDLALLGQPLLLLDLLGFAPMPRAREDETTITWTGDGLWDVRIGGRAPMAYVIEPGRVLPHRVTIFDDAGQPIAESTLRRFERLDQAGVAVFNQPLVPTLIDVEYADGSASLRISIEPPTSDGSNEPLGVVFDRERLAQSIRPDRMLLIDPEPGSAP